MSTMLKKASKLTRETFLEPYNASKPTWTDKGAEFITDVFQPDLEPEQRKQAITAAKPWIKGGFVFTSLFDGHWLLAALPFLFTHNRNSKSAVNAYNDTKAGRSPQDLDWAKMDRDWNNR